MAKTPDALVAVAESQLDYDRFEDSLQGTKYGRWYAELTHSPWFGTNGVPFCMMGASWCCAQIELPCFGLPTAACTYVMRDARSAGKLIRPADMKRGDLILFNWNGEGYWADEADHVGIVTANHGTWFSTIEFNVDNGKVKRREREYKYVVGGIRPDFEKEEKVAFNDVTKKTPHWEDIKWMKDNGIAKGFADGTFKPDAALTRADAAAFLHRTYNLIMASRGA